MAFSADSAFQLLERAHRSDRLGHAYLITASAQKDARELVARLAGLVTDSTATLDHPDVHVVEPESKSRRIRIEQTRSLERELQMRSLLGGRKVAVLLDADRLTTEAANAFLKTLEEPPAHSLLLLTSSAPETLPDTVLSRCITVPLASGGRAALSDSQTALIGSLRDFAHKPDPSLAGAFRIVQVLLDQLRGIKEGISSENDAALKTDENRYKQTTESSAWLDDREDHFKALTEARYLQQRLELIETLLQWWADVLRQQQGFHVLDLPESGGDTAVVAARLSAPEALTRMSAIEDLRENLNRTGVQEQLAIEVAFLTAFG